MSADGQRSRMPFWRRLSVRLAVVFGLAMVAFVQSEGFVMTTVGSWIGLELHDTITVDPSLDGGCEMPAGVATAVAVIGTEAAEDGPQLAQQLPTWECGEGAAYVVTSIDLKILESDLPAAFPTGDELVIPDEVENSAAFYPIRFDAGSGADKTLRWLCLLPRHGPYSYLPEVERAAFMESRMGPDGIPIMSTEEFDETVAQISVLANVLGWIVPLLLALALGGLVSWFVTRRLVRIMGAAADPSLDAFEHIDVGGGDEIGLLATDLASSRERIRVLLQEVEEKDSQRREWFAQVSHDLRTPLTALGACLDRAAPLTSELPAGEVRDRLAATIDVARHDADRVHVLANDLLDAARMELPNALRLEDVPPVEVAERAVGLLAPIADREGKRIVLESVGEPGPVRADGNRLIRVFENLIRNGIHFADSIVRVEVRAEGDHARMTVTDDGPGFSGDAVEATSSDPRGRDRADSAGLGLVVVARILAAHGIDLELDNRPEGGARISFVMPCLPFPVSSDSGVHLIRA